MEQYLRQGLVSDSRVLDIRQVDISTAKMLEVNGSEIPVFVITFATQEVLLFRNAKSGEVAVGAEDRVEQCTYAAVLTRVEEELADELTGGWKVVEVSFLFCSFFSCTCGCILMCFRSTDGTPVSARVPLGDGDIPRKVEHDIYITLHLHTLANIIDTTALLSEYLV